MTASQQGPMHSHKKDKYRAFTIAIVFLCGLFAPAVSMANETSYALQLNSFRVKANADRQIRKLVKEGYDTYSVETSLNDLWYKVRVGPYATREQAIQVKDALEHAHKMHPLIIRTQKASVESAHAEEVKPVQVAKKPVARKPAIINKAFEGDEEEILKAAMKPKATETLAMKPIASEVAVAKVAPVPAVPKVEPKAKSAPKAAKPKMTQTAKLEPPAPKAKAPASKSAIENKDDSVDVVLSQFMIWLQSWQKKQMDSYFSFYSNQFLGNGVPYKDWQKKQVQFLKQNNGIQVEINDVIIQEKGDTIEMTFIETFKSDSFSDIRHKVLIWKKEGEQWKIILESSKPA